MGRKLPRSAAKPSAFAMSLASADSMTNDRSSKAASSAGSGPKPTTSLPGITNGSLKRKRANTEVEKPSKRTSAARSTVVDVDGHEASNNSNKKPKKKQEEKRSRMFRKKAPLSFLEKLERAQNQRMIVIGRARKEEDGCPVEDIDIVGSTGNIYRVTIDKRPSCTCPDSTKGNECKHKVYALYTVLKAPEHLVYQLGLLSTELREIFEGAPPIPTETESAEDHDGKRKPIHGECPICYFDLDEKENELIWCKAACGNNMHKSCFEQWAASQRGQTVKCVYCRTPWEMDQEDADKIKKMGQMTAEGYVNVADHFGMSSTRDYSSYHQPWVRRTLGMGW